MASIAAFAVAMTKAASGQTLAKNYIARNDKIDNVVKEFSIIASCYDVCDYARMAILVFLNRDC
jgi:hypothetical protein